jgi:hypothetical protein
MLENSLVAAQLVTSQEGLSSMEIVVSILPVVKEICFD